MKADRNALVQARRQHPDRLVLTASGATDHQIAIPSRGDNVLRHAASELQRYLLDMTGAYLPMDEWTHVAWTYDGGTGMMKVYVNGVERSHSIGTTGDLDTNGLDLFFSWPSGTASPSGNGCFPGYMDELALYDYALTRDQVLARFAGGPPVAVPEPSTIALLLLGLASLAVCGLRRREE